LHPLDQFRAFVALREKGKSEEEIAAAFFVSVNVVRQRLRLAAVSEKLLEIYAEDRMTLEQLMAFTVNPDPARQEQVWDALQRSHTREAYQIRRMLTEGAVRASDKRAQLVGVEAYEAAGGIVLRDLFESDDGGWLQDLRLLERLVAEKLDREAEAVRAEGWKWIEVAPDFPYGHTYGLRRLSGTEVAPSEEETAARDALKAEFERLEEEYADAEEFPEEIDKRLGEIETALDAFEQRPVFYDAAEVALAGAFVSIDSAGVLRIERGFVRREDESPVAAAKDEHADGDTEAGEAAGSGTMPASDDEPGAAHGPGVEEPDEDEGVRPLSDRLLTELSAHRTLALREAVASDPDTAFLAALHALCLKLFYPYPLDSCVDIEPKRLTFGAQAPGLADTASARAIEARHARWAAQLPKEPGELWDMVCALDGDSRQALFAHCVSLTVNAVYEAYSRRPRALAHAGRLAAAVGLDMAAAGWQPTVESYLGRVTKGRILDAVREAKGDDAAQRIAHLKKAEMATAGEELLAGTGWVPEPLRTPGQSFTPGTEPAKGADSDKGRKDHSGQAAHGPPQAVAAE
jgi:ParB family chromosome partitioning protein